MTLTFRTIALAAATLLATTCVQAHRLWLLPSATSFSAGSDWVTFDFAESSDVFYADHRGPNPAMVKVWAPDGSESHIENAATGKTRSTFDVLLDKPGTWKIGMESGGLMGSFKVNGEERRLGFRRGPPAGPGGPGGPGSQSAPPPGGNAGGPGNGPPGAPRIPMVTSVAEIPADATEVKITQMTSTNVVFVTEGAPTTTLFTPTGKGLEMVPITHPDELASNEPARFRFLVDGKPAGGVKVTILPGGKRYRASEEGQELTTRGDGVVTIAWPLAGLFWLSATYSDQKPTEPRATERRMSFTTTLDVMAP